MQLGCQFLMCQIFFKYLGGNFYHVICDVHLIICLFFCASNCIFAYSSSLPEILLQCCYLYNNLSVRQSCSILRFNQQQIKTLNVCWNSIFIKVFKFYRWELVSQFLNGLCYLNFPHMYYMYVCKFVKSALGSSNNVLSRWG